MMPIIESGSFRLLAEVIACTLMLGALPMIREGCDIFGSAAGPGVGGGCVRRPGDRLDPGCDWPCAC